MKHLCGTIWPSEMHRVPDGDFRKHDIEVGCWCKPVVRWYWCDDCQEETIMFFHNALDQREKIASGESMLQ